MNLLTVNIILLVLIGGTRSLLCYSCFESTSALLNQPCDAVNAVASCATTDNACAEFSTTFIHDKDGSEEKVSTKMYRCSSTDDENVGKTHCEKLQTAIEGIPALFQGARDFTCDLVGHCEEDRCTVEKKEDETGGDQTGGDEVDCETEFCNTAQDAKIQFVLAVMAILLCGLI